MQQTTTTTTTTMMMMKNRALQNNCIELSMQQLLLVLVLTGFYPSPKSFWSCTHVNSCKKYTLYINLHILLNILSKTTSNIQESRKSIE